MTGYFCFADNLKRYRAVMHLTQHDFGCLLGVSAQAVSKWERGLNVPDILLLPEIARLLSVTIDDLLLKQLHFSDTGTAGCA